MRVNSMAAPSPSAPFAGRSWRSGVMVACTSCGTGPAQLNRNLLSARVTRSAATVRALRRRRGDVRPRGPHLPGRNRNLRVLRLTPCRSGSTVHVLYRAATRRVHRDIYALQSSDAGQTFNPRRIDEWELGACPMSSMTMVPGRDGIFGWEHDGNVAFRGGDRPSAAVLPDPQDASARRKHPRLAVGHDGTVLLAWATGTGWKKSGAVGWPLFANGVPVGPIETRLELPVWSFPAAAAVGDRFVLLY